MSQLATPPPSRRGCFARLAALIQAHLANRRMVFTSAALLMLASKALHYHVHERAVPDEMKAKWSFSFYAQDLFFLTLIRILLDPWVSNLSRVPRLLFNLVAFTFAFYNISLCVIALTFYGSVHSEIHWKDVVLATDSHSSGLILSASIYFIIVVCATTVLSWIAQKPVYYLWGFASDLIVWPVGFIVRMVRKCTSRGGSKYSQVPQQDGDSVKHGKEEANFDNLPAYNQPQQSKRFIVRLLQPICKVEVIAKAIMYAATLAVLIAALVMSCLRPDEATLNFISWTTGLLPFIDLSSSSPVLKEIRPLYESKIKGLWDNETALAAPFELDWLPDDAILSGFEDWKAPRFAHYNAGSDPLKISNLDRAVHEALGDSLEDAPIRHIVLLYLESTRNDVFPIKKNGTIWNRLAESWPNQELPDAAVEKLSTLTPNANYITGDYEDGFEHSDEDRQRKRGGMRFTNAATAATYTLKSLTGGICGIPPLLSDFNFEYISNFYQPCLPQILQAMSYVEANEDTTGPYNQSQWESYYFMTATNEYDHSDVLFERMGYPANNTIGTEYLRSSSAKHGPVTVPGTNYFGFEEDHLEPYIRDAFEKAKDTNGRVFLTHLTSTTHHQFVMPNSETMVPLGEGIDDISRYTNTQGYDDKWIGKILNVLDEQGVANETLVVFVGDHGLSMPDNDVVSTYYNPARSNNHVPLVFSHPKLPQIDIEDPVVSTQIVPTILDMLMQTNSLSSGSRKVAESLVDSYEGQSMLRPQYMTSPVSGEANWQFTVVNPGRCMLTIRDAREPDWHLIIPVIDNVEWRLNNLKEDPHEKDTLQEFGFTSFLRSVEKKHGPERARWVEEAAFRTRWWFEENNKRWRYGLYTDPIRADLP
jgi:hypothetical protein